MTKDDYDGPSPRMLPVVYVEGTAYFIDVRLQELREVDNPHRRIPFVKDLAAWWIGLGPRRSQEPRQ